MIKEIIIKLFKIQFNNKQLIFKKKLSKLKYFYNNIEILLNRVFFFF